MYHCFISFNTDTALIYCGYPYFNDIVFDEREQNNKDMGTSFQATASSAVMALCAKAIIGAVLAILLLLIITNLFKKDEFLKKVIFIVLVMVVLISSAVLFVTAFRAIHNYSLMAGSTGIFV